MLSIILHICSSTIANFSILRRKPACFLRASIHASQLSDEHRAPSLQSHLLVLRASLLVSRLKSFTFQKDRVKCSLFIRLSKKGKRAVQQYIYIQYVNSPKKIDLEKCIDRRNNS